MRKASRLSKYFWIFKLDLKQRIYYLADYVLAGLFIVVILFVFTNLWRTIFAGRAAIEEFTIVQLIWYLALTEAITMGNGWRSMFEDVSDEIKSGAIAKYITKPISYFGWYFSTYFSRFLNYFLTVFIIGIFVTYFLVGPLQFSMQIIIPLILLIILSFVLSFFVGMTFVSFSFWFEDVTAFYWILQKALFILGGMLVPIDIYPTFVREYLYYLPFSFMTYWTGKYFVQGTAEIFNLVLIGQIAWIAVFFIASVIIYKIGIRRVSIHGG